MYFTFAFSIKWSDIILFRDVIVTIIIIIIMIFVIVVIVHSFYLVLLATEIVSICQRTLQNKGHCAVGWGIGGYQSVRSGSGRLLTVLRHLLLMLVSTPLRIANRLFWVSL